MRFAGGLLLLALILAGPVLALGADGPAIYSSQCAVCHGADGRGKTSAAAKNEIPDLHSKKVQDLSDADLYETIGRGAKHRAYPHAYLFRGLKEKDISELVKYIRTFGPAKK